MNTYAQMKIYLLALAPWAVLQHIGVSLFVDTLPISQGTENQQLQ
jgi:hypothetical protein